MTTLPLDYARCIDDACPMRLDCLRFLDRKAARPIMASYYSTLRKPDGTCEEIIHAKKPQPETLK